MKAMRRTLPLVAAILVCLSSAPSGAWATVNSQVDFSRRLSPGNQIGFLHGSMGDYHFGAATPAVTQRASQLMPGLWRGADLPWSMDSASAIQMGATPLYVLSDMWNANTPNPRKNCRNMFWNRPLPFQNMRVWKQWVAAQAQNIARKQTVGPVWIDVWNEPDYPSFWPSRYSPRCYSNRLVDTDGSKYLKVFAAAEKTIRKVLGSRARIVGPSAAGDTWIWTDRMMRYCAKVGCRLDAVAWHFAGGNQRSVDALPSYANTLRYHLAHDRHWRGASRGAATPLWMTEYLPTPYHLMPGSLLAYWYSQERAGVALASLTDWRDQGSRLNSLLEADGSPRSMWWAARAYAVGRSSRVYSFTDSGAYSLLAARSGLSGSPEILVGNSAAKPQNQIIKLQHLEAVQISQSLHWEYQQLPIAVRGHPIVELPAPISGGNVSIVNGQAQIQVQLPSGSAWLIKISSAA